MIEFQGQADVFANGESRDQIEELEDESDPGAPEECPIVLAHGRQILSVDPDLALIGRVDAADQIEQRTFAAATFPQDGSNFALLKFGMGVLQNDTAHVAFIICFGQVMDAKE